LVAIPRDEAPGMTPTQRAFLAFHLAHQVERWRWHFLGCQLRAHAGRRTATVSVWEMDDLLGQGLMFKGAGCADVHLTELGRAALQEEATSGE
jgi:hypothetical protein